MDLRKEEKDGDLTIEHFQRLTSLTTTQKSNEQFSPRVTDRVWTFSTYLLLCMVYWRLCIVIFCHLHDRSWKRHLRVLSTLHTIPLAGIQRVDIIYCDLPADECVYGYSVLETWTAV